MYIKAGIARKTILGIGAAALAGGILFFMIRMIRIDWNVLESYPWKFAALPLGISCILFTLSSLISIKSAHVLCSGLGGEVPFGRFLWIYSVSQLGRYLPGKIWNLASFGILVEREGVKKLTAYALPVILQVIIVITFFITGVGFTGFRGLSRVVPGTTMIYAIVLCVVFLGVLPMGMRMMKVRIPLLGESLSALSWPYRQHLEVTGLLIISGTLLAGAFYLFVISLAPFRTIEMFFVGGSFLIAYVFGWMILLVPGGIGVREGILTLLLAGVMPGGVGAVVALASRIWSLIIELMLLGGVLAATRFLWDTQAPRSREGCPEKKRNKSEASEFYEEYFSRLQAKEPEIEKQLSRIERLRKELRRHGSRDRGLFLGTGFGYELEAGTGIEVALDLPFGQLPAMRKRYPHHLYACGDGRFLPFRNNTFDYLVCSEVIEHIDEREKCLREVARVLKPDGVLVLSTPNWWSLYGLFRYLYQLIMKKEFHAGDQPIDKWTTPARLLQELSPLFAIQRVRGSWYWPPTGKGDRQLFPRALGRFFRLMRSVDRLLGDLAPYVGHSVWVIARPKKGSGDNHYQLQSAFRSQLLRSFLFFWLVVFSVYAFHKAGILDIFWYYLQKLVG